MQEVRERLIFKIERDVCSSQRHFSFLMFKGGYLIWNFFNDHNRKTNNELLLKSASINLVEEIKHAN